MASGKVLEETYQKWVQYKEDCIEMMENEPLLQGISFSLSTCKVVCSGKGKR